MNGRRPTVNGWSKRPFYSASQVDNLCVSELRAVDLYPNHPSPIRIDRYIEKRFQVVPSYDDLGPGVLGVTQFGKHGVMRVVVSRSLEEEGTVVGVRRIRATLAHEAGHALLHAHLFEVSGQCALFPEGDGACPRVLCRQDGGKPKRTDWWEIQANLAIAGFLLPTGLLRQSLKDLLSGSGALGLEQLETSRREASTRLLAETFDVNPVVARIRLDYLFPPTHADQRSL